MRDRMGRQGAKHPRRGEGVHGGIMRERPLASRMWDIVATLRLAHKKNRVSPTLFRSPSILPLYSQSSPIIREVTRLIRFSPYHHEVAWWRFPHSRSFAGFAHSLIIARSPFFSSVSLRLPLPSIKDCGSIVLRRFPIRIIVELYGGRDLMRRDDFCWLFCSTRFEIIFSLKVDRSNRRGVFLNKLSFFVSVSTAVLCMIYAES